MTSKLLTIVGCFGFTFAAAAAASNDSKPLDAPEVVVGTVDAGTLAQELDCHDCDLRGSQGQNSHAFEFGPEEQEDTSCEGWGYNGCHSDNEPGHCWGDVHGHYECGENLIARVDELVDAVEKGNASELNSLIEVGSVAFVQSRRALQVYDCHGSVVAHLPVGAALMAKLGE